MKETSVVVPEEVPAIGLQYVVELPGKKQISFQTHVAQEMSADAMNQLVDKVRDVAARQYWYELIDVLTLEYQNHRRIAIEHKARMDMADATFQSNWMARNKRGDPKLTEAEQKQKQQAELHLKSAKEIVEQAKKKLLEAYKKAGMEPPTDLD